MPEKPPVQKLRPDQYHNPDISDEQTRRIGQVIVLWSKLEAAMEDTIWMLLNLDDEDGKVVTKRLSTDAKVQLLRGIGSRHISDKALLDKFNETLKYVDELKECRNFIAHGVWGTLMPDDIPVALSLKPKSDVGEVISETFSQERMEGILKGIRLMLQRFVDLPEQLGKPRRVPRESPRP
ncbi:MAG: hypothetical protein IIA72_24385 [Proteobacteria bacterium]|nr:hypothetical protein [Pseudomonadota bacterium]